MSEPIKSNQETHCLNCKDVFIQKRKSNKFCSEKCGKRYRRRKTKGPKEEVYLNCELCGDEFKKYKTKRFCSTSCSAKWRMSQDSIKEKVHNAEVRKRASESMKENYRKNPNRAKESSERMKRNNPMKNPESVEKMRQKLIGRTFLSRGGNSQITQPQLIVHQTVPSGWIMEYPIPTKEVKDCFPSLPTCYKVDLGNPELKIAIEVDGNSHKTKKWKFLDKRKTEVLEKLGWKVYRFWNQEILEDMESVIARLLFII